jgi:hypothetical protein
MTFRLLLPPLVLVVAACARSAVPAPTSAPAAPPTTSTALAATAAPPSAAATSAPPATSPVSTRKTPLEGEDFIAQAMALFRVAACGPSGEAPAQFDKDVIAHHCADLERAYSDYRRDWVDVAKPFLASLRPKDLPAEVIYPFGGGDLTSALATFPDAEEITTISLEPAGDVRPIDRLAGDRLPSELATHRGHIERLFAKAHSRTDNLDKEAHTELPGEIIFALAALVVYGAEPVSLRYFRLRDDGSLAFVSQADISAAAKNAKALRKLFENAELRFRRAGDGGNPVQVLRHIAFNLDDDHMRADPALLAYLNARGEVAAMTKAASHLLWSSHFSLMRGWLLEHSDWMVSDSTGISPRFAKAAGFTQETYGRFDGPAPFGLFNDGDSRDFRALFASQPERQLGFRYGYPDRDGHAHLIVTSRLSVRGVAPSRVGEVVVGQAPRSPTPAALPEAAPTPPH